jgi:autotransporter-associated beta strand protein
MDGTGGGGAGANNGQGGSGGSGIVLVRYASEDEMLTGGSTNQVTLDGRTYTVHSFTNTSGTHSLEVDESNVKTAWVDGKITGSGDVTVGDTDGTIELTAANDVTGQVTVATNTTVDVTGSLPDTGEVAVESGGTYKASATDTIGKVTGTGSVEVYGTNTTLSVGGGDQTSTFGGSIEGSGSFNKVGTGTISLTGDSDYAGTTTVTGGVLSIGAGSDSGSLASSLITVASGGTLQANRSDNLTLDTVIDGAGEVVKAGTGSLTLAGDSTYSGGTTVKEGTLKPGIDNTLSGTTIVSGAFGTGTVAVDPAVDGNGDLTGIGAELNLNGYTVENDLELTGKGVDTDDDGTGNGGALTHSGSSTANINGTITLTDRDTVIASEGDMVINGNLVSQGSGDLTDADGPHRDCHHRQRRWFDDHHWHD